MVYDAVPTLHFLDTRPITAIDEGESEVEDFVVVDGRGPSTPRPDGDESGSEPDGVASDTWPAHPPAAVFRGQLDGAGGGGESADAVDGEGVWSTWSKLAPSEKPRHRPASKDVAVDARSVLLAKQSAGSISADEFAHIMDVISRAEEYESTIAAAAAADAAAVAVVGSAAEDYIADAEAALAGGGGGFVPPAGAADHDAVVFDKVPSASAADNSSKRGRLTSAHAGVAGAAGGPETNQPRELCDNGTQMHVEAGAVAACETTTQPAATSRRSGGVADSVDAHTVGTLPAKMVAKVGGGAELVAEAGATARGQAGANPKDKGKGKAESGAVAEAISLDSLLPPPLAPPSPPPVAAVLTAAGQTLTVLCCTANVANTPFSDLGCWIPQHGIMDSGAQFDVVAMGLQECLFQPPAATAASPIAKRKFKPPMYTDVTQSPGAVAANRESRGWLDMLADQFKDTCTKHVVESLQTCLGPDYVLVQSIRAMQMRLVVFIRAEHSAALSDVERAEENTGVAHVVANKGGQVIKFTLYGHGFCFVSCHLAAGDVTRFFTLSRGDVTRFFALSRGDVTRFFALSRGDVAPQR
jgi:hypothetical protein